MSESRVERLKESRDRLVGLLASEADGSKAASLSREIRALEAEIAQLDVAKGGSKFDEVAARRAARLAEAKGSDAAEVQ